MKTITSEAIVRNPQGVYSKAYVMICVECGFAKHFATYEECTKFVETDNHKCVRGSR